MQRKRVVWKLGGSVLETEESFNKLAAVIKGYLASSSKLEKLYIVVSAMKGETDRRVRAAAPEMKQRQLLADLLSGTACEVENSWALDAAALSKFLLEGEMESARKLCSALDDLDIDSRVFTQDDYYPIATRGSYLRAEFDPENSSSRFHFFEKLTRDYQVVILSGFGAVNQKREPVLLGRNASDLVAALMSYLDRQVEEVVYIKDVEGIYQDFNSPDRKLISLIEKLELLKQETGQVLDLRVLEVIACDFFVTDIEMKKGTRVLI